LKPLTYSNPAFNPALFAINPTEPSADAVPEGAFWSQRGRQQYESRPDRFRRGRLLEERAAREQVLEAFDAQYGDGPDGEVEDG